MKNKPVLEVTGLTKHYKNRRGTIKAVDGISFEVFPGEVVGFLGPNGAGKTTAIKAITGLADYTGIIKIDGVDLKTDHVGALRSLGAIVENPDFYLKKSAEWNLKYLASLSDESDLRKGCPDGEKLGKIIDYRVAKALAAVGLTGRKDSAVKSFSLGMKQRLGIAQTLITEPKLLILDEPANGLDPDGIKEIRDLIRRTADSGCGVLVSSHQLHEMQLMCDRVLIISSGKIAAALSIDELGTNSGGRAIDVKTDDPAAAKEILIGKFDVTDVRVSAKAIRFRTSAALSDVTRELVMGGVNVYGVSEEEVSLEDVFMSSVHGDGKSEPLSAAGAERRSDDVR